MYQYPLLVSWLTRSFKYIEMNSDFHVQGMHTHFLRNGFFWIHY